MRVLLRADAGVVQGTGHVMRCLTLAEALTARGHDVHLLWAGTDVAWLAAYVDSSAIPVHQTEPDSLDPRLVEALAPDWVVVDSYRIPAEQVSKVNATTPVLAIIDGDDRGIEASLYLDQNLGAENAPHSDRVAERLLAGARYALVRNDVLRERKPEPWNFIGERPTIMSFMGGTDPTSASALVVESLLLAGAGAQLVIVAPVLAHGELRRLLGDRQHTTLVAPTPGLPDLFAAADIVVSAAGTSAWDVCSLAIPSILIGVVDNQSASIAAALSAEVALGVDASNDRSRLVAELAPKVTTLLTDRETRRRLSESCQQVFDGAGKQRVVDRMEEELAG